MKKILALVLVLVLSMGMITGCNDNKKKSDPSDTTISKILRLAQTSDITSLDSTVATDQVSLEVLGNTIEGLFTLIGGNKVEKGLVESFEVSRDSLTYTFELRDAVWSNGKAVTANDFVYAWRRLANPNTGSQYAFLIETAGIKNGAAVIKGEKSVKELGVKADDEKTLVVELDIPVPFFKNLMTLPSFFPINQEFAKDKGDKYGTSIETTLFCGPYKLSKWEAESEYELKKNKKYWDKDNVSIDIVNFKIVEDLNDALDLYESDDIDAVSLSGKNIADYADHKDLTSVLGTDVYFLQLNQANEIFKNVNARRALSLAIDKTFITEKILGNGSIPADYLVPSNLANGIDGKDFRENTGTYNTMDKEKAIEYWTKAKEELGITKATVSFLSFDTATTRKISDSIKEQLQNTLEGLSVDIEYKSIKNKLAKEDKGDFDFSLGGWGPDYGDPMTFLDKWITNAEQNIVGYSSEEYDNIIKRTKSGDLTTNLKTRWTELQRAEKILLQNDVVIVPLYQVSNKSLKQQYIRNMNSNTFAIEYYFKSMDILK